MGTYERVLFPTDFSENSEYALDYAIDIAEKYRAELITLNVILQPVYPVALESIVPSYSPEKIMEQMKKEAEEKIDKLIKEKVKGRVTCRKIISLGTPYVEIIETARNSKVDLIVMATHGRTGLAHVFLGSVAEKVVRKSLCPVLTVKHPSFFIRAI